MKKLFCILILLILIVPAYGDETLPFIDQHGIVMLIIDPASGEIIYGNEAAVEFYGYKKSQLEKLNISHINILSSIEVEGEMALAKFEKRNYFEFKHLLKDGRIIDVDVYSYPVDYKNEEVLLSVVIDKSNRVQKINALENEISRKKKTEQLYLSVILALIVMVFILLLSLIYSRKHNKSLKQKDQLTNTYNRISLRNEYNKLVRQKKFPIAFFMIDVQQLKFINDVYGHEVGDRMVKDQAKMLLDVKYRDIKVARVSGDEFVLILPDCAVASAKILNMDIMKNSVEIEGFSLNTSVGYTIVEDAHLDFDTVFSIAESSMYRDKEDHKETTRKAIEKELIHKLYNKEPRYKKMDNFTSQVSVYIAKELSLDTMLIDYIKSAALLQNIGLSEVEDSKDHTEMSYRMLNALGYPKEVVNAVRYHHEYYDGTGYPFGLSGKSIPVASRIICLVNDLYIEWTERQNLEICIESILNKTSLCYDAQVLKVIKNESFILYLNTLIF